MRGRTWRLNYEDCKIVKEVDGKEEIEEDGMEEENKDKTQHTSGLWEEEHKDWIMKTAIEQNKWLEKKK